MVHTKIVGEAKNGHIVIVHGIGEHFRRHHRLINRAIEQGYKVHTFDWPGHGKSEGPRGHARIERVLEIIDGMIEDIDEKPFLYGHSLGGLTVLRYAEENPEKIKSVISSSPALKKSEDLSGVTIKLISFLSHILPRKIISNSLDVEDVTRSEEERKKYKKDDMVHDKVSLALTKDIFQNVDKAHEKKDKIDTPLLLLIGTDDKICPIEGAERFFKGFEDDKDKKIRKFDGSYHEIFNDPECEEDFHDEIINWVEFYS